MNMVHGEFKEGLWRLGLTEDPRCNCPLGREAETPKHTLYMYTKYRNTETDSKPCARRGGGIAPTAGYQDVAQVLQ